MSQDHRNRLAAESSPYLLQHAGNPVDWYPWGEEALSRARAQDKPILLSVGYSACHWCHVMGRECFEDQGIARLMNRHFVCIKVDREERPDIDHLYMEAVQAMTGHGGWPLTVFLTPSGEPFYGGTYFPPENRHGLPGFPHVLAAVAEAYLNRRSQVTAVAQELASHLGQGPEAEAPPGPLAESVPAQALQGLEAAFDGRHGGFGPGPKFPQAPVLEFLLQHHHRTGAARPRQMAELTLDRMAAGGIYDHLGGGFHRYATDGRWLVPHFEKMLYDNALLARLYLHAWLVMGKAGYRRVAQETLDYVLREMSSPAGGFCSSQDADTGGEEGRYYLWTPEEIGRLLGEEDGRIVSRYFGVGSGSGEIEGRSVLHLPGEAGPAGGGESRQDDAEAIVARARARMLEERGRRAPPARDSKVLASWNGLMLQALAEAGGALGRPDYREAALRCGRFLAGQMMAGSRLAHSHQGPDIPGYLEDYAAVARGFLSLHEITLDQGWLEKAFDLGEAMLARFGEASQPGLLYDTEPGHGALFARPRNTADSAAPCGLSSASEVLLRLSRITGQEAHQRPATALLGLAAEQMGAHPLASGHWLCALELYLAEPEEIVVVGQAGDQKTEDLLAAVHGQYLPHRTMVGWAPDNPVSPRLLDLARDRGSIDGAPAAYVCRGRRCYPAVTAPGDLRRLLIIDADDRIK